jgi:hypothetical protein
MIVLRAPRPVAHRERLDIFGDDVQVGSTQVRVVQRGAWMQTLLAVLTRLDPTAAPPPLPAHSRADDYGTFATGTRPTPSRANAPRPERRAPAEEAPPRNGGRRWPAKPPARRWPGS